jgi:hypothetical protein
MLKPQFLSAANTPSASSSTSSSTQNHHGGLDKSDTIAVISTVLGTLLAVVMVYIGIITYRRTKENSEDTKSLLSYLRIFFLGHQQQREGLDQGIQLGRFIGNLRHSLAAVNKINTV